MSNGDIGQIFGSAFDSNQYEPMADFEVLPPGKYQVVVEKAEVRDTKAGTGRYVWLEMNVVNDPKFNNRKVWANINIVNPNTQCVQIGLSQLSALTDAAGIQKLEDSSQLVGVNVIAHVKVKDNQNNVRTFSAVQQGQPGTTYREQLPQQQKEAFNGPPMNNPNQPTQPQEPRKPAQGTLPWSKNV